MAKIQSTTQTTHWQKCTTRTTSAELLPLAVAILVPHQQTPLQAAQLIKAIESVPFAQTVWIGQTTTPITDFSAARNSVFPLIQEPWVLWLDSDEWLENSPQVVAELKWVFAVSNLSGVHLQRRDWFLDQPLRHGEPAGVMLLRLMKTGAGYFHRPVHEVFTVTDGGKVTACLLEIQHASHTSISEFLISVSSYAQLEAAFRKRTLNPSALRLVCEFLFFPKLKFLVNFFWLGGWRDGWRGLIYALLMSIHSAAVRIYGWELLTLKQSVIPSASTTK